MSASKKKNPQEKHRQDLINGCEQSDYVVCEHVLMTKTKLFILKAESVCQTRLSRFPLLSDNHFLISNFQVSFYYASLPSFIIA